MHDTTYTTLSNKSHSSIQASFLGLPRFYLSFAITFTTIFGSRRAEKKKKKKKKKQGRPGLSHHVSGHNVDIRIEWGVIFKCISL